MASVEERMKEQKEKAVSYFESMPIYKHAAAFAGISEDTLKIWRDNDQVFSDRLQEAKAEFIRKHGKRAKPEFLLERLDKENFKESIEHTVILPTPIMKLEDDNAVHRDDSNNQDQEA